MSLIVPHFGNYSDSASEITQFCLNNRLDYCIYGSFVSPSKVRPGLSDIDVFAVQESKDFVFPIEIIEIFGDTKSRIEALGIPLQINWVTTGQLENRFFSPDYNYIEEVKRGYVKGYSSPGFENIIGALNSRDERLDDQNMARHFHRKCVGIGLMFGEITKILEKDKDSINEFDQKRLNQFWDSFKKMMSLYTIAIRILNGESLFSKSDEDIVKIFKAYFDIEQIVASEYIHILKNIKNIEDWFYYLQKGGILDIKQIYNSVFIPFVNAIGNKL